ncbi:MAG: hypothetical protein IT324_20020 [Anaerolineae bacterium]|nr:hypothetical protein [Anaerolineae bacterium]
MSSQSSTPEPAGKRGVTEETATLGKYAYSVIKAILFIAPLVAVLVIIVLAQLGPAIGNTFSYIVSSL